MRWKAVFLLFQEVLGGWGEVQRLGRIINVILGKGAAVVTSATPKLRGEQTTPFFTQSIDWPRPNSFDAF
jgi:hypothetical protein